jgi:hypothetical protein
VAFIPLYEEAGKRELASLAAGRSINNSKVTVSEYLLDVWLPARRLDIGEATAINYEAAIRCYVLPRIGHERLQDLRAPRLNWLYSDIRENGRTPVTASDWTISHS